jgi:hypothetical protein
MCWLQNDYISANTLILEYSRSNVNQLVADIEFVLRIGHESFKTWA